MVKRRGGGGFYSVVQTGGSYVWKGVELGLIASRTGVYVRCGSIVERILDACDGGCHWGVCMLITDSQMLPALMAVERGHQNWRPPRGKGEREESDGLG